MNGVNRGASGKRGMRGDHAEFDGKNGLAKWHDKAAVECLNNRRMDDIPFTEEPSTTEQVSTGDAKFPAKLSLGQGNS
jgi:hypothetical protein